MGFFMDWYNEDKKRQIAESLLNQQMGLDNVREFSVNSRGRKVIESHVIQPKRISDGKTNE